MSDKTLTNTELELTQRFQLHFPRGIDPRIVQEWNGYPKEMLTTYLASFLQNRGQMQVVTTSGIVAPEGGIVWLLTAPVNKSRTWDEAVRAAAPSTPKDHNVWKLTDQYPPLTGAVERLEQIYVVNFGKYVSSQDALAWGKEQYLVSASPRACFAIGEHFPKLHVYLGMNPMAVVSLWECSFGGGRYCCRVWFDGSGRGADLRWFGYDWLDARYWFAFVR